MAGRIAQRALRAGSSPLRRYFNAGFEGVKDELRRGRAEAERDRDGILVAIDRLEEAIGFLGLQLSLLRSDIEALRASDGDQRPPDTDRPAR